LQDEKSKKIEKLCQHSQNQCQGDHNCDQVDATGRIIALSVVRLGRPDGMTEESRGP